MRNGRRRKRVKLPRKREFALKTMYRFQQQRITVDPLGVHNETYAFGAMLEIGDGNSITRGDDPDWKVKVAKGIDATNPYSLKRYEGTPAVLSGQTTSPVSFPDRTVTSTGFLIWDPALPVTNWTDSSVQDLALKRLKVKLSEHVGLYQSIAPVAELKELRKGIVGMIDITVDTVHFLGREIARRKLKGRSLRATVADAWLQWSFGIKPTINEVRKANEAIQKFLLREDHVVRLTGSARLERNVSAKNTGTAGLYGASINTFAQGKEQLFYKYVGAFDLKLQTGNDYSAQNIFGVDVAGVVDAVYQLTPYSWLLDYFTSVGDFLSDDFILPPGSLKYLSLTRTHLCDVTTSMEYKANAGSTIQYSVPREGRVVYKSVNRTKLTTLPHLSLRIKTLEEIGGNGLNKLANLVSLLKSAHGGRYRGDRGLHQR